MLEWPSRDEIGAKLNGHFSEQREQSDACIGYAESRRDWSIVQSLKYLL
ncbi:MAG: hypothetical protein J6U14_07815 [Bacteroidaceae bacterium]|nr:hypothetical protein [Bacteroidaceae bacterium]